MTIWDFLDRHWFVAIILTSIITSALVKIIVLGIAVARSASITYKDK